MLSIEEALGKLNDNIMILPTESRLISESLGYVLAEDVYSPIHMPPFRQSAMDGYAIVKGAKEYSIVGEVKTGDHTSYALERGQAVRIFTGAMVPEDADTVIQQELVRREDQSMLIEKDIRKGANIRPMGEQIKEGDLALVKGTKLNPASIGFLTTLGIYQVKVYAKPRIQVLVTGNELVNPGSQLLPGQIYESNSSMLIAALEKSGYVDVSKYTIRDNFEDTQVYIQKAILENDLVLITGGISVGDYDFVGKALESLDAEQIFYKVKQKPGKPLYCGKKDNCMIFALPGNPAAALTCYYVYVLGVLRQMCGENRQDLFRAKYPVNKDIKNTSGRGLFLKAKTVSGGKVEILDGQSSAMLNTFAIANALVYIPSDKEFVYEGEMVEVIPIL